MHLLCLVFGLFGYLPRPVFVFEITVQKSGVFDTPTAWAHKSVFGMLAEMSREFQKEPGILTPLFKRLNLYSYFLLCVNTRTYVHMI